MTRSLLRAFSRLIVVASFAMLGFNMRVFLMLLVPKVGEDTAGIVMSMVFAVCGVVVAAGGPCEEDSRDEAEREAAKDCR